MNQLKKLIKNLYIKKYRGFRRRRTRFNYKPASHMYNTRVKALGWQQRTALISYRFRGLFNQQINLSLGTIMESSEEYNQLSSSWNYYKLKGINIIFEPSNTNDDARPLYLNLVYGQNPVPNIETDDQTKVVPGFRTNFKSYYYRSPSIQISTYAYQMYHTFQDLPQGTLSMFAPESTSSWGGRIEFVVKCKASKTVSGSNRMLYMKDGNVSNDSSLYEEIKEEERNLKMEQQIATIQNILLQLCSNVNNKVSSASVIECAPQQTSAVVTEGGQLQVLSNDEPKSVDALSDKRDNELGGYPLKLARRSLDNRVLVDSSICPCDDGVDVNGPFNQVMKPSEMVDDQRSK